MSNSKIAQIYQEHLNELSDIFKYQEECRTICYGEHLQEMRLQYAYHVEKLEIIYKKSLSKKK